MRRILLLVISIILSLPLFLVSTIKATDATDTQIINQLKSACYDHYSQAYAEKQKALSANYEKTAPSASDIEYLKSGYKEWAEINIDLLSCYQKELSSYPQYAENISAARTKAEKELQSAENYNFEALLSTRKQAISTINIPAKETKVFRLLTFCLDSGRSTPDAGEEFYLAGSVDQLPATNLCTMLTNGQKTGFGDDAEKIQSEIWGNQKFPTKEVSVTNNSSATKTTFWASEFFAWILSIAGLLIFLFLLIFGLIKKPVSILEKIIWVIGLIGFLAVGAYGSYRLYKTGAFSGSDKNQETKTAKSTIKTPSGKTSVFDASLAGQISVRVISAGEIKETDLIVQNNSDKNLELDVSCLYLIPVKTGIFEEVSGLPAVFSIARKAKANPGLGAQKVGISGSTGDGPPIPGKPTEPGDMITSEMKQLASLDLNDALSAFKQNPSEDNLKDALDKLGKCQAVGCDAEDGAMDKIKDSWQKVLDQKLDIYKNNQSTENQEVLLRAVEIGQYVGCNTDSATTTLGL